MNFDVNFPVLLIGVGSQIPHIVTVIFSAIYYFKKQTTDGLLILIGGVAGVLVGLFHVLMPLHQASGEMNISEYSSMLQIVSGIGFFFNLFYVVGFVMLMIRLSKPTPVDPTQRLDLIDPQH